MNVRYWYKNSSWFHVGFDYDAALVQQVKKFTGAQYNPANREWSVPFSLSVLAPFKKWLEENGFAEGVVYRPSQRVLEYQEPEAVITPEDVLQACKEIGLTRTPRYYQAEGVAYMINHGNCINGDDCGLGKAQPLDTKILTPDGFILMKDIKIGDKILGADGEVQTVEAIYPKGVLPTYKVIFSDGTFTRCCNEHLWNVATDNWIRRGTGYQTLSLDQIMQQDIYLSDRQQAYRFRIPIVEPICYEAKKVDISPYLLGVLLGDGGITRNVYITTIDKEMLGYLELPKDCILCQRSKDSITYRISGKERGKNSLKSFLKDYKLFGTHSYEKFIPSEYLYNSIYVRLEVLRGLLDTDGTVTSSGHISYSTTSEQLAKDMKQLVWSLGGIVRERTRLGRYKQKNGEIKICRKSFRLSIMLPPDIIPFKLQRKIDRLNTDRKYVPTRKIVDIQYLGGSKMQCIKVSNSDGLYLCDDFIVTHNTAQQIITIELLNAFPALIIVPASVKYNWKKEWAKWNPNRTVGVIDSKKRKNAPDPWSNDVVVINYDILGERGLDTPKAKHPQLLKKYWGSCIFDEIHFLKSEKALRTKMAKKIAAKIENVWGLTGTLTQKRPADLIQPFKIIRRFKDIFGDSMEFKFRYCNAKKTIYGFDISGFSNLEELHELLRMGGYIRRNKRDVLDELPPLVTTTIDAPISNLKEYKKAEDDLVAYLEKIDINKANSAINAPHLVMMQTLKRLSVEGKMKFVEGYIKDWLEANEDSPLLVFGVHREPLQRLAAMFKAPIIQGGVDGKKKQQIVDEFSQGKHRVLFANIKSAGTGTDGLQENCSNLLYIELPDSYSDIEQVNSRLERMGQKGSINVTRLLCPDTIDVQMNEMMTDKSLVMGVINRGESENVLLLHKILKSKQK